MQAITEELDDAAPSEYDVISTGSNKTASELWLAGWLTHDKTTYIPLFLQLSLLEDRIVEVSWRICLKGRRKQGIDTEGKHGNITGRGFL